MVTSMTTKITKDGGKRELPFDEVRLRNFIRNTMNLNNKEFEDSVVRGIQTYDKLESKEVTTIIEQAGLSNMGEDQPSWTYKSAKVKLEDLYNQASKNRGYDVKDKYGDFYELVSMLIDKGIYTKELLNKYSKEEIDIAGKQINPDLDLLLNYPGLLTLETRYLVTDFDKNVFELPQERWLIIALSLMQDEDKGKRMHLVKEAYWALSNLYMTVATPTLSNAGRVVGQLSSCFVDTVDDSLVEIYGNNTDIARLSKWGGGIGVYMGKVRSRGSSIRGFKGASSGVVPWIKQLNNTAVSVDQLGQRQGAVAVYLDVWHKDIYSFLDLKLNNGDERMRAHDVFTGVTLPDLFMETVENRGNWYLFDPHEVKEVMGYSLEDFYDEKKGKGTFREKYNECVNNPNLSKTTVEAIDIIKRMLRSQLETGTPFMFYRDEVNRKNPNKHEGIVYSSNLCTEIAQNMSVTVMQDEKLDGDVIVTRKKAGDFVVCNLSSINLGRAEIDGVLERLIPIQVRMLDNVIDLNTIEVLQAKKTNHKYRGIDNMCLTKAI